MTRLLARRMTSGRLAAVTTLAWVLAVSWTSGVARAEDLDEQVQSTAQPEAQRPAQPGWVGLAIHGSIFGDLLDRSTILPRFGYGVRGGWRRGRAGVYGLIERDHWIISELDLRYVSGVLNVALGGELLFAGGRMSASLALGVSVLLRDQPLDKRGSTGLYVALRPVSLRYNIRRRATVQVDLLSFVVEAPSLRYPVLIEVQYRASVTFELGVGASASR